MESVAMCKGGFRKGIEQTLLKDTDEMNLIYYHLLGLGGWLLPTIGAAALLCALDRIG